MRISPSSLKQRDPVGGGGSLAAAVARPSVRTRSTLATLLRQRYLLVLVLPAVVWMIVLNYIPMLGLVISFKNYDPFLGPLEGFTKSPWVGLKYFKEAFTDRYFLRSLWKQGRM